MTHTTMPGRPRPEAVPGRIPVAQRRVMGPNPRRRLLVEGQGPAMLLAAKSVRLIVASGTITVFLAALALVSACTSHPQQQASPPRPVPLAGLPRAPLTATGSVSGR